MADEDTEVEVAFGDNAGNTATLLLAAAEDLDLPASVVRTTGDGLFVVPAEVAKKAKVDTSSPDRPIPDDTDAPPPAKVAKKAAPRKTASKTASKRAAPRATRK